MGGKDVPGRDPSSVPSTSESPDFALGPAGAEAGTNPGQFLGGHETAASQLSELFVPMEAGSGEEASEAVAEFSQDQSTEVLDAADLQEITRAELEAAQAHGASFADAEPAITGATSPEDKPATIDARPDGGEVKPIAPSRREVDSAVVAPVPTVEPTDFPPNEQTPQPKQGRSRLRFVGGGALVVAAAAIALFLQKGPSKSDGAKASPSPAADLPAVGKVGTPPSPTEARANAAADALAMTVQGEPGAKADRASEAEGAATIAADPVDPEAGESAEATPDGPLQIRSTPQGAAVYVDGARLGETPFEFTIDGESHQLAVLLEGHELAETKIQGGGDVELALQPVGRISGLGGIKVRCKVSEQYRVFLNGQDTGQMCPTERLGVSLGEHQIETYDVATQERRSFDVSVLDAKKSVRVKVD